MGFQHIGIFQSEKPATPAVFLDVIVNENHTAENQITSLPVENGSPISDHAIVLPDVVEISAEMSNYDGTSKIGGERSKTAWQQLKNLRNTRTLVDVSTEHELYKNMVISSLTGEHVPGFKGRIRMSAKFQKIDISKLTFSLFPESLNEYFLIFD